MRSAIWRSSARSRRVIPVIERLETRTLLSAAPSRSVPATAHARALSAIGDTLAAAGYSIWQNGQAALPGGAGGAGSSANPSLSSASPLTGPSNGTLFGSATVTGGAAIFSVLPVLPPDGLAAEILGLIDPSHRAGFAAFSSGYGLSTRMQ